MKTKEEILKDIEETLNSYIESKSVSTLKINLLRSISDTEILYPSMDVPYKIILNEMKRLCKDPNVLDAGQVNPKDLIHLLARQD